MTQAFILDVGMSLSFLAMAYAVVAVVVVRSRTRRTPSPAGPMPRVTVLKPLCGAEAETYECLRSVCNQDYPEFDVVFGIAESDDPSVAIAVRLQREFPERNIKIVIKHLQHGTNRKVSNLMNMMPMAGNEVLVLSDSDVRVRPDYLARIVAPMNDPNVGIVTCAYRGRPSRGVWSSLGAQFINEWFLPSVSVAAVAGSRAFAFGATIAIRRKVLARIGGFASVASQLADDYRLGELTRQLGLRTVLSDVVVETAVTEASFKHLVQHELRWLRTIRALRPLGHVLMFITFGVPVAIAGAVMTGGARAAVDMLLVTVIARGALHFRMNGARSLASCVWLLPARDVLSVCLWLWSFTTRHVRWRDDHYHVLRDGSVQLVVRN